MTLRPIGVIAFLLLLPGSAGAQEQSSYIGLVYPPMPDGCKLHGGGIVEWDKKDTQLPVLGVDGVSCRGIEMAWLGEFVDRRPYGIHWRVIDVLTIPPLQGDQSLLQVHDGCEYADHPQTEVYAIGHWVPSDYGGHATDITQAWIVNVHSKRFEDVPPDKVTCRYEEDRG